MTTHNYRRPVMGGYLAAVLLFLCAAFPIIASASSNSIRTKASSVATKKSWLEGLSGIPIIFNRRSKRRLNKKIDRKTLNIVNVETPNEHQSMINPFEEAGHRFLAFGDYSDPTFNCPAVTTCPIVCVASLDDCPADARCPESDSFPSDHEYGLCADGTCADLTAGEECDAEAKSPCECDNLSFVCAKQVDYYEKTGPGCFSRFQEYYDANTECLDAQEESLMQVDFNGPWFKACYISLIGVTALMLLWCAWNQRLCPVEGSSCRLESASLSVGDNLKGSANSSMGAKKRAEIEESAGTDAPFQSEDNVAAESGPNTSACSGIATSWTQTGYKSTIIGMLIYSLIVLAHLVIQFLLLLLTVEYYKQQELIFNLGPPMFESEIQVLMAFEIVWMTGFVWCFFLKYPASIKSLFLRRCLHSEASYVAVSAPVQSVDTHYKNKMIVNLLAGMGTIFRTALSFIYSEKSQHAEKGARHAVTFCKVRIDTKTGSRYFYFRMRRYVFNEQANKFIPGCWSVTEDATIGKWLESTHLQSGLSSEEAAKRLSVVGPNVLDLKKPTLLSSISKEFSKPFYLYQNFMVWTWAPYMYYYMAITQTVVRVSGGLVVAVFQYLSDMDLYRLMVTEGRAEVIRNGELMIVDQTEVVPGDIVRLTPGAAFFDMSILQSRRLLVDESSLTGEVHPISKIPLDPADSHLTYDPKTNKSSTISAGTTILECGENDLAIVTQTGSFTAKGELLSDVLSYERHKFKFDTEVKLVIFILAIEAIIMLTLVIEFIKDDWVYGWFYGMFVVGTVLPPLLPTVFVVSVGISNKRLQGRRITCTDARAILVAGKVKKAFFDKTGTLTEQGLVFVSAIKGEDLAVDATSTVSRYGSGSSDPTLQLGLAVCHTLSSSAVGELVGPAVDRMGFSAVPSAQLLDENSIRYDGETVEYLKRFEFDHHTMTQSVIIRRGKETLVYVKGSPEAIRLLCLKSSLPRDFEEKARQSARDGIYQLAMASSDYNCSKPINEVTREDVEKDLTFSGFINFQNAIKKDTPSVIQELRQGNIASAMITGDNVLTGVYIAKKAGLIEEGKAVIIANSLRDDDQVEWLNAADDTPVPSPVVSELQGLSSSTTLAMTGEVWNHLLKYDPKSALEYAQCVQVFGRCTPNDKVSIVSTLVELGEITLMCGDGGNDCGALKAANVGIALSDAEASVVAPFTSLDKTISSVVDVVREGRCALASALASYKYMIMYGQVESINQIVNAYFAITFTEWCWVFMDGLWTITMAFSLPLAKAAKSLSAKRPTASLLGPHTLSSACGVLAINFLFLVFALLALNAQDWYQCRKWDSLDVSNVLTIGDNYESSVIFLVTGYQYISSAAAYNFGYSHRANWFRNYVFVFFFLLWTSFQFAATLSASKFSCIWRVNCDNTNVVRWVTSTEPEPIYNNFNTTVMPMSFRGVLLALMIANLILICAWDYFIVNKALSRFGSNVGIKNDSQHEDVELNIASGKQLE